MSLLVLFGICVIVYQCDKTLDGGSKIVGVYYSNERINDSSTPVFVTRLAEGVKSIVGECAVIQIKNELLSSKTELFIEVGNSILLCNASYFSTSRRNFLVRRRLFLVV